MSAEWQAIYVCSVADRVLLVAPNLLPHITHFFVSTHHLCCFNPPHIPLQITSA